jgi:hypothetical protein
MSAAFAEWLYNIESVSESDYDAVRDTHMPVCQARSVAAAGGCNASGSTKE